MTRVKVTITSENGEVLDTIFVDGTYLEGTAAHPENMLGAAIVEVIEENFETSES
jgi:hypothetical protein